MLTDTLASLFCTNWSVQVLNQDHTRLIRPEGAWWVDPMYHRDCDEDCQICRLTNPARQDFVPPAPLAPGEGLPGVLWAETGTTTSLPPLSRSGSGVAGSVHRLPSSSLHRQTSKGIIFPNAKPNFSVVWRELKPIADDPDQPWNPRLQVLANLGLGWAAAVSFAMHGQQGIVVYMAREGVDFRRLQSPTNEAYLMAASEFAGAAYALRMPRRQVLQERHEEQKDAWNRVRNKIAALRRAGVTISECVNKEEHKPNESIVNVPFSPGNWRRWIVPTKTKAVSTIRKTVGAGTQPPPVFGWDQTLLTFVGVFISMLMLTRLNVHMIEQRGQDYAIVLGPFGALLTLLYGLTAAPASQPRNVLLGQTIAMTISLGVSYSEGMTVWMRQSLATALAIAAMVKLGVTHPPAGASALLYASGDQGWSNMLMMLVGNVIAVGSATLINNSSETRQYPMYWTGYPLQSLINWRKNQGDVLEKEQDDPL